jgi:hypothetical protein
MVDTVISTKAHVTMPIYSVFMLLLDHEFDYFVFIHAIIDSFLSLSYERPITSFKANSPQTAIKYFLL